jgi:hypothetical protein
MRVVCVRGVVFDRSLEVALCLRQVSERQVDQAAIVLDLALLHLQVVHAGGACKEKGEEERGGI